MHHAQVVHRVGGLADKGQFADAAAALSVSWDDLIDVMGMFNWTNPSQGDLETLVATLSIRSFVDRIEHRRNQRMAAAMFGKVRTHLQGRPDAGDLWVRQLLCVIAANLADNHRQAEEYREADSLFNQARAHVSDSLFSVGATAALMQGLMWLDTEGMGRAEPHLVAAGKAILVRPMGYAPCIREFAGAVLVHLCGNDFSRLYQVFELPDSHRLPDTDAGLMTAMNAGRILGGTEDLMRGRYLPLYRPI